MKATDIMSYSQINETDKTYVDEIKASILADRKSVV